jgi:hypothetical protein
VLHSSFSAAADPVYEDVASKFFEHFIAISSAINTLDATGLWDEQDGFYYDRLRRNGVTDASDRSVPLSWTYDRLTIGLEDYFSILSKHRESSIATPLTIASDRSKLSRDRCIHQH